MALVASVAADASGHAVIKAHYARVKCGHLYQPHCFAPAVAPITLGVACHAASSVVNLPGFTISGDAGLKSIKITVNTRTIVLLSKQLGGATRARISGIAINTRGFHSGVHTITIKIVDNRGRTATRTVHFAVCKPPKPPFTG